MNNTLEEQDRIQKLNELRKKGINPFPAKCDRTHTCHEAKTSKLGTPVIVAGRLMSKRIMGKLGFFKLKDQSDNIQLAFSAKELDTEAFKHVLKYFDMGDFIQVSGETFTTHKGEVSVLVKEYKLLTKTLKPLPDKFHGLQDEEERLRKRYLDILLNDELLELFNKKAMFWSSMRDFLIQKGFTAVETPVLETTPGGADAEPFITHHNSLDIDVYLRISMGELWQKRLMVAGMEKTFEIGRQFRNEGMSREHLQDYTQMEFYWAYANYEQSMVLVEEMYKYVIEKTFGTLTFTIGKFENIDLSKKWEKISYADEIMKQISIDVINSSDKELLQKIKELKINTDGLINRGRIVDTLWKYCRKNIKGPVFLIDHPVIVSPLAKRKEDNPELTERYQVMIAGSEIGNGYSELNDPIDQAERFNQQAKMREEGDSEAQMHDKDFVTALEHGMPPTSGFGVSERLFSFLANKPIRECVMFPLLKPEHSENENHSIQETAEKKEFGTLPMNREGAWQLVKEYNSEEANLHHYLESECIMRALARHLNQDEELWGMLGLLHDIDWELTKNDSKNHLTKAPELLKKAGFNDEFISVVLSHGYGFECAGLQGEKRTSKIEHALACSETITGLIYSASLMRPEKISTLTVKSLKKKFKDKKFAANVNREIIKECEKLGIELDDFFQLAIDAMKEISNEIGL